MQLRYDLNLKDISVAVIRSLSNCFASLVESGSDQQPITADPGCESEGTWGLHGCLVNGSAETLFAV